jgi:hypothetical protein
VYPVAVAGEFPPPNTRVQRTRAARFARQRSPLTRSPLGGQSLFGPAAVRTIAFLLTVGALSSCSSSRSASRAPLDIGTGGLESLSGEWQGTMREVKTGSCTIGWRTDKRFQGSELKHSLRAEWLVSPDGSFTTREFIDDVAEPTVWTGVVDQSLRIDGLLVSQAACRGEEHESHVRLTGSVFRGPNGPTLEVSGQDDRCPTLGCSFTLTYELVKRR